MFGPVSVKSDFHATSEKGAVQVQPAQRLITFQMTRASKMTTQIIRAKTTTTTTTTAMTLMT